ncbi:hypothetical protein E2C01_016393 [Portunus trituberculatus]|uniref:Uncharacterized protein n=1 Tax=Portunus trituberculatus TaxID=210409 RepID=A0A5B7DQG5_PORTR|nr:hypothetical protein [Portunus trituberculatus]
MKSALKVSSDVTEKRNTDKSKNEGSTRFAMESHTGVSTQPTPSPVCCNPPLPDYDCPLQAHFCH